MERLTTNKNVSEMGMLELALNCCYITQDGNTRYRDYEKDIDARHFTRVITENFAKDVLPLKDESFDEEMMENLMYDPLTDINGMIAVFYRNMWAMAELREKLKRYEDSEEQGLLLRLPCKEAYSQSGDNVYLIYEDEIVECVHCRLSVDPVTGKGFIALVTDEDIFPYRNPIPEYDLDPTDWCDNATDVEVSEIGNTLFFTREEAEAKLAEMEGI